MRSKIVALSKNEEFKNLLNQRKISNKYVTIFYGNLENKNNKKLNISFVTKKKIGNAVTRNKIKRRLRNIMHYIVKNLSLKFEYSYLVIAKSTMISNDFKNIKNTIDQTKFNLDIFSSYREQDLPGPRVKGGAVYNYHFCNRYEDSKTAKHIGGSFAANGDTCNTDQRDDYSNLENERINLGIVQEINSLKKIYLNIGYKKKNDKAFLAANGNTKETPNNGDRYLNTTIDGNIYNARYEVSNIDAKLTNILNIGFDHSHSFYDSKRYRKENEQLGQKYDADLKVQSV